MTDANLGEVATEFRRWLEKRERDFAVFRGLPLLDVEARVAQGCEILRLLTDGGWTLRGWAPDVGGVGGDIRERAMLYDVIAGEGIPLPEQLNVLETVGPALEHFAPRLAATFLPAAIRGTELWCQGFSEPDAGSDLASLRCRAARLDDGTYSVSGQKTWTSFGHLARRMVTLVRTGSSESRHRGLTMFLIDLDSPGITRRPIALANGEEELAEVFFDDVRVPAEQAIGDIDGGWAVAMYLLQFERGMYAWLRMAHLRSVLAGMAAGVDPDDAVGCRELGRAFIAYRALRARTWRTIGRLADGENPGPEISVDKVLLATAEQTALDMARTLGLFDFAFGPHSDYLRSEWFYTRAASIYGGSAEVQRSILADRVLHLPKEAQL